LKTRSSFISFDKIVLISALYISQSVPVSFLKTGFQVFLKSQHINYDSIARYMGLLLLPWALKFLWAPLVDSVGNKRIGHRKSWIIPMQVAGALVLGIVAFLPLEDHLLQITLLFLLYSFICATQDIAVDGLTVLSLTKKQRGIGNSMQLGGYYLGELLGGAVILIVFEYFGWTASILALALFFLLPLIPLAGHREEVQVIKNKRPGLKSIADYFRGEEKWWLVLLVLYMGNQVLARTMFPSILQERGMSIGTIGSTIGIWGNSASLAGAIIGGMLISRYGRKQSLVGYGILKIPAFLLIPLLELPATSDTAVLLIIMVNDFVAGLATVTLFTIMMDRCRRDYPGTDFSIQQSVNTLGVLVFVILSGILMSYGLKELTYTAAAIGVVSVIIAWKGIKYVDRDAA
jgi:PAT family beta-lactamase induction signal transducer AmpG